MSFTFHYHPLYLKVALGFDGLLEGQLLVPRWLLAGRWLWRPWVGPISHQRRRQSK